MTPAQHLTWDSRPGADGSTVHLPKYSEAEAAEPEPKTFTPAPWRLDDRTIYGGPDEQSIAELTNRHHSSMLPNGRLIAAAPEMLEALRALLAECEMAWCVEEDEYGPNVEAARAAIAKAEGRKS